ncbi:hypothetical protein Q5P01_026348 [Channa striata]|uniref:Ig-like domain-containing protein n=1 Tax=Channa striata TaxID=64152 RepID=A0AA88LG34_CHASR|nr:hypothetical protein Q5P01_026348 [Channa striata]
MYSSPVTLILCSILSSVAGQAPVVSVEPQTATVRQGESVSFRCHVRSGTQPIKLEWRRDNNQALSENVEIGPDGSVLTFTDTRPEHHGRYHCVADSSAGRNVATAVLNVKLNPDVEMIPQGPLQVKRADPVSVECRATGNPQPQLIWKRVVANEQLVLPHMNKVKILQWASVHPEDSGHYLCLAKNSGGVAQVGILIIVEGEPGAPVASVNPTKKTVVEGQTVTIECRASASPTPVITWSKLHAPLPQKHRVFGGYLTLIKVRHHDSGQYICNATNIHGYSEAYTQVEVATRPNATCVPEQVTLQTGNSLQLQCLAHGSQPIWFKWSRVGRANLPAGAETTKNGKLMMSRVKVCDSGTYKCVARNRFGSSEALANVIVNA